MSSQLAGNSIACPSCGRELLVPPCAQEADLEAAWDSLDEQQQKLDAAERELAQTKSVLVEVLQQFRAAKNALAEARSEAASSEKTSTQLRSRLRQLEETESRLQLRLRESERHEAELKQQLELTKTQRGAYLWETRRLTETLEGAESRQEKLVQELEEREKIMSRAQEVTEKLSAESQELKRKLELKSDELARALDELQAKERAWLEIEQERAQLREQFSFLQKSREAVGDPAARLLELEAAAKKAEAENAELRSRCERAEHSVASAEEETFELRVQLAALREVANDSQLYRDNQLLRGVIERNNEQLRALANASKRRRFVADAPPAEDSSLRASLRWLLGHFFRGGKWEVGSGKA